jgi:hypothetical protein
VGLVAKVDPRCAEVLRQVRGTARRLYGLCHTATQDCQIPQAGRTECSDTHLACETPLYLGANVSINSQSLQESGWNSPDKLYVN